MKRRCRNVVTTLLAIFCSFNFLFLWSVSYTDEQLKVQYLQVQKQSITHGTSSGILSNNQSSQRIYSAPFHQEATVAGFSISTRTSTRARSRRDMNFTLVTGSDSLYFDGLVNLVGAIHYWEPYRNIAVYNLGMLPSQNKTVHSWCKTTLIDFDLQSTGLPKHVMYLKKFAWKPLVLKDAVERFGKILWIDAGCDIRGALTKIDDYLREDGHFFVQGQDTDMTQFTHRNMFEYFNETVLKFKGKYSFAGGINGWVKGKDAYHKILPRWVRCSLDVKCIAPPGTGLGNHRFDQSALSVIAYTSGMNIAAHTELLAASRLQLNPNPMQPSPMLIYTARRGSKDYIKRVCKVNSSRTQDLTLHIR